ncbi:MAG: hypothetical protein JSR21_03160 [Proteobacteria bacterium]|nr:hypothetical protein [Pseudomonadota bacterium]
MLTDTDGLASFADLARDPLVRLVMASDGVTEDELVSVLQTAQRAVAARTAAPRRGRTVVPFRQPVTRRVLRA